MPLPVRGEVWLERISHSVRLPNTARWLLQAFLSVLGGEGTYRILLSGWRWRGERWVGVCAQLRNKEDLGPFSVG